MSTLIGQIDNYSAAVSPVLVTQYSATFTTKHLLHDVLGSATPDITLQPAGPRSGTMAALLDQERDAARLFQMLQGTTVMFFTDDDTDTTGMTFVANGSVTLSTDDQDKKYWVVTFDYLGV